MRMSARSLRATVNRALRCCHPYCPIKIGEGKLPLHAAKAIVKLGDGHKSDQAHFGQKAALLSEAACKGFEIPTGFAISAALSNSIATTDDTTRFHRLVAPMVRDILEQSSSGRLIVRSSSTLECHARGGFSGLFRSCFEITNAEAIFNSIKEIITDAKREELFEYFYRLNCKPGQQHMAIVVQEQVEPRCSGLAKISGCGIYIELCRGHLKEMVSGETSPVALHWAPFRSPELRCVSGKTDGLDEKELSFLKDSLNNVDFFRLQSSLAGRVVEFGIHNHRLVIFQVNDNGREERDDPMPLSTKSMPCERAGGVDVQFPELNSKIAAMRYFHKHGLFNKRMEIFQPGFSPTDVVSRTHRWFENGKKVAVRVAKDGQIGLPRGFFTTPAEVEGFVSRYCEAGHSLIAHEYIEVVRSFELLLGSDFALLEHVPGMWESSNDLQPDVIALNRRTRQAQLFRYRQARKCVFGGPDEDKREYELPLSFEQIESFYEMIDDIRDIVTRAGDLAVPVHVHSVWDRITNRYQCLNLRKGFPFDVGMDCWTDRDCHLVSGMSDLERWDGRSAIRLALRSQRGSESNLNALAELLAALDESIIVDFGILSHPAMILRDFGCKLVPSYLLGPICTGKDYEAKIEKLDVGHDAFCRMQTEPRLFETKSYIVVRDREPVSEDHVLGVCKYRSASSRDTGQLDEIRAISEYFRKRTEPTLFYERGRRSFCSSGFSDALDHFHLVSGIDVGATFSKIRREIGGKWCATIKAAYEEVPLASAKGYCIVGSESTGYVVSHSSVLGKHLLRRSICKTG